jgi:hypothetical protein
MKPAEVSSTKATFLLPQNSPTCAVMAAFRNSNFMYQIIHPDSPPVAGPSHLSGSLDVRPVTLSMSSPQPPKRDCNPASDPDLPTLSKRMRLLGAGLVNTSSGSFLISKTRARFDEIKQIIAPPVLECIPKTLETPDQNILHQSELLSLYSCDVLEN